MLPVIFFIFFIGLLSGSFIFLILIRTLLGVVTVRSHSMSPTLEHGDRVLTLRHWPSRLLRKGNIVIVQPNVDRPIDPTLRRANTLFIKRIVGMPGDTIRASFAFGDDTGFVNDIADEKPQTGLVWGVPAGHVFVRGDYAYGGFDSRCWGPVPFRSILAIVVIKLPRKSTSFPIQTDDADRTSSIQSHR